MTGDDREGLTARIRQVRRLATPRNRPNNDADRSQEERLRALETRMGHLEQMLEGLQDSVHRESERHSKLIAELQGQVDPAAMGQALAKDRRDRGL